MLCEPTYPNGHNEIMNLLSCQYSQWISSASSLEIKGSKSWSVDAGWHSSCRAWPGKPENVEWEPLLWFTGGVGGCIIWILALQPFRFCLGIRSCEDPRTRARYGVCAFSYTVGSARTAFLLSLSIFEASCPLTIGSLCCSVKCRRLGCVLLRSPQGSSKLGISASWSNTAHLNHARMTQTAVLKPFERALIQFGHLPRYGYDETRQNAYARQNKVAYKIRFLSHWTAIKKREMNCPLLAPEQEVDSILTRLTSI